MAPGLIWILLGLALLGAELFLPGVFLVWVGIAAIGTGILLLGSEAGFASALVTFLLLLGIGIAIGIQQQRSARVRQLNTPEAGLAGREARVIAATDGALRVRLGDSDWPARLAEGTSRPAIGAGVRVEGVDGTVLIVRPLPSPGP